MKKILSAALAVLLLLALLTGCGSQSANAAAKEAYSYTTAAKNDASWVEEADYGYSYDNAMVEASAPVPMPEAKAESMSEYQVNTQNPALANVKLIYTADINLQTTEFDDTIQKMNQMVASLGGYFESSSVDNYSNYRYGYYTIRVPAENFETLCTQAGELCQLTYISRSAQDVSESYYDTESRLTTQRTKLDRLQELLAKAENMEDIITLESAISDTEWAIENLTGTLRHYDSLVGYSTVRLSINEVYKLTEVEQPVIGFGAKLADAFKRGCSGFVDDIQRLLLRIARNWVGLLLFVIVVIVVLIVVRRFRRRRKAARAAKNVTADNASQQK